ncbi:related to potassium channel [Lecanosticta acicola]|uniref:Related to potassium channel n=1 Tax=Lecanosticta acicola TaxID=111012 RepID=A0AAI8YRM9_9PEZI|nr:related to potassium channel [Lecanosticta acicola]
MSTIDPGIGEPVAEAATQINSDATQIDKDFEDGEQERGEERERDVPGHWWLASTAIPLIAATFGPVANGFSICALVYSWRSFIPEAKMDADGIRLTDPKWLIAINAVSLLFALLGNATLLLNMAKRLKFTIAQPMTIVGFILAGILLVADIAAINSSSDYYITDPQAQPAARHALTSAYYYAIFAAAVYLLVGLLMCFTVYGAHAGHYKRDFDLTPAQRTLMLQTISFMFYLLLGALVFSHIEGWKYLDGVYWAQVTLLTVGLGDYSPQTTVGRGLLFPFAIGGILIVGLVVGSIRSLVLERGKEKIAARITEKRRENAVHNVDKRKQTVKISWFAQANFRTDPSLTPAQRREEEFHVMRKVQLAAERERRYLSLCTSLFFVLLLWFVGAVIFMVCERDEQGWTYFEALYFTFVVLLTIGYGDLTPSSNSGKAFFVIWSLLAVPSLTILISNMGDTIVKSFSDLTNWVASFTLLPEKKGKSTIQRLTSGAQEVLSKFTPPGLLGETKHDETLEGKRHYEEMLNRLATRLQRHVEEEELEAAKKDEEEGNELERDIHFYNYVLSREMRQVQKDLNASPPKQYSWHEWEYFLKLMGSEDDEALDFEGQKISNVLVPEPLKSPPHPITGVYKEDRRQWEKQIEAQFNDSGSSTVEADKDGVVDRETERKNGYAWRGPQKSRPHRARKRQMSDDEDPLKDWSWLSEESPLMSTKTESEWILERLSMALVRELNRQRKGYKRQPPIRMRHVLLAIERRREGKEGT